MTDTSSSLRIPRIATILALAATLLIATGCSRIYTSTTPFGDKEYRVDSAEAAHRVNGWPIFYLFDDNLSILWPLFQKSDEGFVIWPVVEHKWKSHQTLVGLGILGDIDRAEKFTRVGPVCVDTDDKQVHLIPLFFSEWKKAPQVVLFPVFAWLADSRTVDRFLSIPFSRGPGFVNVGVLLYHLTRDTRYTRHNALAGLLCLDRWKGGSIRTWQVLPFYRYQHRGDETKRFGLLGLIYAAHDDNPPNAYRTKHFLPFFRYRSEGKAERPDRRVLNVGGILYRSTDEAKDNRSYRSVLWPIAHRWRSDEGEKDLIAPLFYRSMKGDSSVLATPLFSIVHDGPTRWISLGYLLFNHVRKGDTYAVVSPLASWGDLGKDEGFLNIGSVLFHRYWKGNDSFTYLTPLFWTWSDESRKGFCVLPLFLRNVSKDSRETLSPIFSYRTLAGDKWQANLGILLAWISRSPQDTNVGFLANLIGYSKSETQTSAHLTPFLRVKKWSVPAYKVGRSATVFPLFHRRTETRHLPPPPFPSQALAAEPNETEAPTVTDDTTLSTSVLRTSEWNFLILAGGERRTYSPLIDSDATTPTVYRKAHLWPLWRSEAEVGCRSESKVLFGAVWNGKMTSDKEGVEHVRNRLLWRLFDYERKDRTVSIDMFPFIAWDHAPKHDYRAFSFFGPVLRRVKKGDAVRWNVLGIPLGDEIALQEPARTP